ncbi:MAG: DUF1634 domain-containing protein [Thermoplasmata archaeon]
MPPKLTRMISFALRIGVGLAAALAIVGVALLLSSPAGVFTNATVHGAPFSAAGFVSGLVHGQAVDILLLALLVLIATPLSRVIISIALFAQVGDRPFTLLTVTVLVLLGTSVLIGALA